jgi:UDP-2,3-diacylglucosamine pyrophosphatase LpxH
MEPAFEEVHVVSDLHLGGASGAQIFNQGARLAALIRGLRDRPVRSLALVLNGDVVDFLADPNASYLDPAGAVAKLSSIVQDPAFADVWQALREFVATPATTGRAREVDRRRRLVIVLGNHDVELALPHVQHWLVSWLANGDDHARGRVVWATDGAGFLCTVGSKRVLCVHGNEVDAWNVVDHRALLQVIRASNRSVDYPEWSPNGGTRLVVDVMNAIKRDFPFVDLLKPETKAAVPILLGIKPSLAAKVGKALGAVTRKSWDGLRMSAGFLGEEDVPPSDRPSPAEAIAAMLPDLPGNALLPDMAMQRVLEAQKRIERGERLQLDPTADGDYLGIGDWFSEENRAGTLRVLLGRLLGGDTTFKLDEPDDPFLLLKAEVGASISYLIAGHTHLRRALKRQWPDTYYYNTGTWIRLIALSKQDLASAGAFKDTFAKLSSNLSTLDSARNAAGEQLVMVRPTVASVIASDSGVYGELSDVNEHGGLEALAGTRFPAEVAGHG